MKIKTVEYGVSMTLNLGNFQNIKPEFKATAEVEGDESPGAAAKQLKDTVDGWLERVVKQYEADLG